MKSSISSFALSLVLLSTSATLTSAVPAPLPAATGYASNSEEAALAAEARAQLRPVWRPGPRLDEASAPTGTPSSSSVNGLSARQGPVFRRNAESKFQYRKRTSAGLAVVGNLAYGLGERDVASPFGISGGDNHVPLPVQMRVRREASLMERDDNEEEDWDCSEYDDDEDEQYDDADDSQDHTEQWSAPAPSSSSDIAKETPSSSSSAAAPAASNDSSNANANAPNPLLTNNVIGTKKDDTESQSESASSSVEAEQPAPAPSSSSSSEEEAESTPASEAYIAPAPQSTEYTSNVFVPETTQKASLKKTHVNSKSKSSKKTKTKALKPKLTTPADVAPGTLTVEEGCTRYHTVVSGEVCLGLLDWSKDLNLTLEQLYSYNPAIDSECMNLQIGWGVCIGASPSNPSNSSATSTTSSLLKKRGVQLHL